MGPRPIRNSIRRKKMEIFYKFSMKIDHVTNEETVFNSTESAASYKKECVCDIFYKQLVFTPIVDQAAPALEPDRSIWVM